MKAFLKTSVLWRFYAKIVFLSVFVQKTEQCERRFSGSSLQMIMYLERLQSMLYSKVFR